jgi:serine/threonine protein kinase
VGIAGADAGAVSVVALQGLLQLRSQRDLFAFGAIFYEMLSGKRAFHGASPADTMSAILKEDPPELTETGRQIPLALEGIVRHCLEKNPQRRFQSAQDLAFNLEQLSQSSGSHVTGGESGTQAAARSVGTAGRARSGGSRRHRFHRGAVRWSRGKTEFSPTDISAGPGFAGALFAGWTDHLQRRLERPALRCLLNAR